MNQRYYVIPESLHDELVRQAFLARGYAEEEVRHTVRICREAARHGIRTHNAIKALHLDTLFGSRQGGAQPKASVAPRQTRFPVAKVWDAKRKIGPAVAYPAIEDAIEMAERFGIGMISVDHAFHYFWGGGYVLEAAKRGYIAYTQCTALLAEVVPFGGKKPTMGTNPHSWAFPTTESLGFPVLIDWATSKISMGGVQGFAREGKPLPEASAVDADGAPTQDPSKVAGLLPFGEHKGYSLGLINELVAGFVGGSIPTARGLPEHSSQKNTSCFLFIVIHPDAISGGIYADERTRDENIRAVVRDILGHGNDGAKLPGQQEAENAARSERAGGLLFTEAELDAFDAIAAEAGTTPWDRRELGTMGTKHSAMSRAERRGSSA